MCPQGLDGDCVKTIGALLVVIGGFLTVSLGPFLVMLIRAVNKNTDVNEAGTTLLLTSRNRAAVAEGAEPVTLVNPPVGLTGTGDGTVIPTAKTEKPTGVQKAATAILENVDTGTGAAPAVVVLRDDG